MKRIIFFISLVLILGLAFSQDYPTSIKEINAIVTLEGNGTITNLENGEVEIKILTFQENAKILKQELIIDNTIFEPQYVQDEFGNRYLKFVINKEGSYNYIIQARINNISEISEIDEYKIASEDGIFVQKSTNIESDSKEIISLIKTKFKSEYFLETINEAIVWTNDYLTYPKGEEFEKYYQAQNSAIETLIDKKGVCDEFTNLTAAILRAKKIPTRVVVGISYDGKEWGHHAWLEIYEKITDKWIANDSTFREVGFVDAGHIKLGVFDDITSSNTQFIYPRGTNITFNQKKPQVELIDVKYFDYVKIDNSPIEMISNKWNDVNIEVENLTEKKLLVPVTLFGSTKLNDITITYLEEGLGKNSLTKSIILNPNETGQIKFRIYPLIDLKNQSLTGEFVINSLSKPIKKPITIINGPQIDNGLFKIMDVTPIITFDKLILYIDVFNGTNNDEEIEIYIIDGNTEIKYTEISKEFEQKTIGKIIDINNLNQIKIKSKNYSYIQNIEKEIVEEVDESKSIIPSIEPKQTIKEKQIEDILIEQPLIIITAILLAIAIISIGFFISKSKYF